MCSNYFIRANVISFATALLTIAGGSESKSCQTDIDANNLIGCAYEKDSAENFIEAVCDVTKDMVNYDKFFLISLLWNQMEDKDQVKMLFKFYSDINIQGQCDIFALLQSALNEDLYIASKQKDKNDRDLNLEDLKKSQKETLYSLCDVSLQSFINNITERKISLNDNENFKCNVYENLLKARNSKFNSIVGIKEHMVAYLASEIGIDLLKIL